MAPQKVKTKFTEHITEADKYSIAARLSHICGTLGLLSTVMSDAATSEDPDTRDAALHIMMEINNTIHFGIGGIYETLDIDPPLGLTRIH